MKTLHWRHTDWSAKNFIFWIGTEVVGQLSFKGSFDFKATYSAGENKLRFSEKEFWGNTITIEKGDARIGQLEVSLFGKQVLTLANGKKYELTSKLWGNSARWTNNMGEDVMTYTPATMSSMGKGIIHMNEILVDEDREVLLSGGLFVRQLIVRKIILIFAVLAPLAIIIQRG